MPYENFKHFLTISIRFEFIRTNIYLSQPDYLKLVELVVFLQHLLTIFWFLLRNKTITNCANMHKCILVQMNSNLLQDIVRYRGVWPVVEFKNYVVNLLSSSSAVGLHLSVDQLSVLFMYIFSSVVCIFFQADVSSDANINVLNMKDKSYQILPTADDIKVNRNEYINILALTDVTEVDNGTYICFVAKNGLNSLTFKSASVHVVQGIYCLLVITLL